MLCESMISEGFFRFKYIESTENRDVLSFKRPPNQSLILEQAFIYGVGTTNTSLRENIRNVTTALPLGTSRSSFSSKCQTSLQRKALRIIKTSTHRPKTANKMEGFNMSLSDFLDIFPQFLHLFAVKGSLELRESLEFLEG